MSIRFIEVICFWGIVGAAVCSAAVRPNILWLTSEDNNVSWVGCYGNPYAETPNIDRLAAEGFQYMHAYANAPVCAPSRSTWITGINAISMGTHPMRSRYDIPHDQIPYYPDLLRANGYYTGNFPKTDYNIGGREDKACWDNPDEIDWTALKERQPFFQVINFKESHESRAQGGVENTIHNPSDVRLRKYHPDLPADPTLEDVRPYLHTRNNLIENNEIHHAMQILGDGNGIYIRGAGPGNVIRRNYIHHLVAPLEAQGAIRTDGGQTDTLIAENLIYKCKSQGMTLKLNNRFENNIVADVIAPRGIYLKIVEGPMAGASNKRNIYYSSLADCTFLSEPGSGTGKVDEDSRGRDPARMKDIDSDHNIYYCKAERGLGEKTLEKLQSVGVDANSRAVDPLFVDPENGDFRFRPDSPALKLGIVPFDMSKVGLRIDKK